MQYQIYQELLKNKSDDKILSLSVNDGLLLCSINNSIDYKYNEKAFNILFKLISNTVLDKTLDINILSNLIKETDKQIIENKIDIETNGILCLLKPDGQFYGVSFGETYIYNIKPTGIFRINSSTYPKLGNNVKIQEFYGKITYNAYLMICTDHVFNQCPDIGNIKIGSVENIIKQLRGDKKLLDDFSLILASL